MLISEISLRFPTFFGGLYYVNGDATTDPVGGRTFMLGDTRGVNGGQYALGRTQIQNGLLPGPVHTDLKEYSDIIVYLYVKKDC